MDELHTPSLSFDSRGHLVPYEIIEITLPEFEAFFVEGLDDRAHRRRLFRQYLRYLELLKKELGFSFFQWIGGSFTTQKKCPFDIDMVNFLSFEDFDRLPYERTWLKADSFSFSCPEHHWNYEASLYNKQRWQDLFGYGREAAGVRHPKGIVQLNFNA